jgi:hypothetical protein
MLHFNSISKTIVLLFIISGCVFAFSTEPLFDGGISYRVGEEPRIILNCDLNGDNNPDLIVVNDNANDSTISVLLNKGDGSFESAVNYNIGGRPRAVAAGDFWGDSLPDLAVALYTLDSVVILVNEGDSLLADTPKYAVESAPSAIIAADLNGDTLTDLATINYDSNSISILINNGDSTFITAVNYATDSLPIDICAFRLNGDDSLDLAVVNEGSDNVTLYLNNGDGSFTADSVISMGTGNTPRAICANDLDSDGDDDLAVAFADRVMILYNDSGVLAPQVEDDTLVSVRDIIAADIDNDNDIDLITTGDSGLVTILDNLDADSTFGNIKNYGNGFSGNVHYSLCAADFDGDNNIDLAVSNSLTDNISVLFNYGNGVFPHPASYPTGYCAFAVVGADFDNTSGVDLVVSNWSGRNISFLINNGDSTFQHIINYSIGDKLGYICSADFDGINGFDLAVTNYDNDSVSVFLHFNSNNPISIFTSHTNYYAGPGPYEIQAAKINGDNLYDLVVGNYDSTTVAILTGNSDGTFNDPVFVEAGSWLGHVRCYDYDNDGDLDLITANYYEDSVGILLNDGNGVFTAPTKYYAGDGPNTAFPADLDNDGDCDLVVTNYDSDSLSILLNDGTGALSINSIYAGGLLPSYAVAVDFDGDTDNDLVVANQNSHDISVFENIGAGNFTLNANYGVGRGPRMILAVDIDGDTDKDLVVCHCTEGMITVILNRSIPSLPTDIDDTPEYTIVPEQFILQTNYPNPFNPSTTIKYNLPKRTEVAISIFNILGRKIATIVNESKPAGEHIAYWDGLDTIL